MTALKVEDLAAERKKLASLRIRVPERVRRLRDEIKEAEREFGLQYVTVKWYSWVADVIESLGPEWRLIGDSTVIVAADDDEFEIFGAVELCLDEPCLAGGGFSLELSQEPGSVCLRWTCPVVKNQEMDLVLFLETATRAASVINAKVAEVRASAKEQA